MINEYHSVDEHEIEDCLNAVSHYLKHIDKIIEVIRVADAAVHQWGLKGDASTSERIKVKRKRNLERAIGDLQEALANLRSAT